MQLQMAPHILHLLASCKLDLKAPGMLMHAPAFKLVAHAGTKAWAEVQ